MTQHDIDRIIAAREKQRKRLARWMEQNKDTKSDSAQLEIRRKTTGEQIPIPTPEPYPEP